MTPSGYTTLTSDRLATPSGPDAIVGFDLHLSDIQPNPNNYGEVKLFVDLPSQGIYSTYVGRTDLLPLPTDTFARVSFTLPANVVSKLTQEFDDLRFRVELNVPPGAGPYLLDRFRFGSVTAPTESVTVSMPTPANLSANKILLLAKDALTIGAGVKLPAIQGSRMVLASLGSLNLGAGAEVDSLLASGRVDVGANAKVTGFIAGTTDIHLGGFAQVFGESGSTPAPTTVATWTTSFEPSTLDLIVSAGQRVVISPGRYRNVIVRGTLALSPGTYRFDVARVEGGGVVEINSNLGATTAFVRSELNVNGRLVDSALFDPDTFAGQRSNTSVWLYSGTKSSRVPLSWPGLLVAPGATITPYWDGVLDAQRKPSLGGIWAGTVTIPPPPVNLFGDVQVLRPPFHDLLEGVSTFLHGDPTDVRVVEQEDPTDGSRPFSPVLVYQDNPAFFGSFEWAASNEAGSGTPPYYTDGTWTRIGNSHLALRHSTADDIGWSAQLLPGGKNQSPATSDGSSDRLGRPGGRG